MLNNNHLCIHVIGWIWSIINDMSFQTSIKFNNTLDLDLILTTMSCFQGRRIWWAWWQWVFASNLAVMLCQTFKCYCDTIFLKKEINIGLEKINMHIAPDKVRTGIYYSIKIFTELQIWEYKMHMNDLKPNGSIIPCKLLTKLACVWSFGLVSILYKLSKF